MDNQFVWTGESLHVVGVGASAGGLEAIEVLFDNIAVGTQAAYVVIQHLSPDFNSLMDQLLARHTSLSIHRAEDGMLVEADHIYLLPPRKEMTIHGHRLRLVEQRKDRSPSLVIDTFFTSLAQDLGPNAIGIVLSGTGSDGSRGIRAIKEAGGSVLVQDERSAKFDGMPRAAAATGIADAVLPPWEMAIELRALILEGQVTAAKIVAAGSTELLELAQKKRKGIDFSQHKAEEILAPALNELERNVSGLALFSKVDELTADKRSADLAETAKAVQDRMRKTPGFPEAEVVFGDLPLVTGSPEALEWLLFELVRASAQNALDAAQPAVRVSAALAGSAWEISIADNGAAPGEHELSREVFFPYRRGSGRDLALAVSALIVRRHGGDIWIRPAEPQGRSVTISLPLTR